MSASSQPKPNSQGSTPFGWPDVSAAQLPTSRTPETPRTHRIGCKPGSLAHDSSSSNQLPKRLRVRGSNSPPPTSRQVQPAPFLLPPKPHRTKVHSERQAVGLGTWATAILSDPSPPAKSPTHCGHPSSSVSCVFTGSDNVIHTKPWMLSSVIGYFLEAGASSRTVPHRLEPHLLNNCDGMERPHSTYLCVY